MTTATDGGLYKLLVIGGGPAGVGVFIRAARTGFMDRLLNPALHGDAKDVALSERLGMKQKGVAIVHDGDASTFGSGNLGKYIIHSNTFARSLLSSVLDEKPDLDPPESIKNTFLERTKDHESTKKLEETGNAPACLVDFGNFLQTVGACLLTELSLHAETSKCLLHTRATRFERLESGIYRVEVTENDCVFTLHTEHLVLAMGGKQERPTGIEGNAAFKQKLFSSDDCLHGDGFAKLRDRLLQSENKKVCIVGGSHSSFSVAWLLLNKGNQPQRTNSVAQVSPMPQPTSFNELHTAVAGQQPSPVKADVLTATSTVDVRDPLVVPVATLPNLAVVVVDPVLPVVGQSEPTVATDKPAPLPPPRSVVKPKPTGLVFQPRDITILHRSPIRCYYMTRKDAEADGADASRVDRTGCVNTFTGLREDSKHLFKDVKAGKECRVRLFQVNQRGCQNLAMKAYESAAAIVWCCGYSTCMIPGFDHHGDQLQFQSDHGVVALDLQARLQLRLPNNTVSPAPNLQGVGLGFSLRAHVDEMGTVTRADGVTVYHRRGATLVLAALFGPEVFGTNSQSFEEMVEKNDSKPKKKKSESCGGSSAPAEPSLMERVKRSGSQGSNATSCASPSRTPVKVSISVPVPVSTITISAGPRVSPDKPGSRPVFRKKQLHTSHQQMPGSESNNATPSDVPEIAETHPPVKMLLQRRRSAETLHESGSASGSGSRSGSRFSSNRNSHGECIKTGTKSSSPQRKGSGSVPKLMTHFELSKMGSAHVR